jgi:prevent-host-death family protein
VKTLQLREAKASLSAVVDAAERGEATTITRHGRPAAVVIPVEVAQRLLGETRPNFAAALMEIPDDFDFERDQTPMRDIDL